MPDMTAYLALSTASKASQAWARINERPQSVTFKTPAGTTLGAQTVRVEYDNGATDARSPAGNAPTRKLVVFGVRGLTGVTDTNVKEGYRFIYDNAEYRIVDRVLLPGEIQATAEVAG